MTSILYRRNYDAYPSLCNHFIVTSTPSQFLWLTSQLRRTPWKLRQQLGRHYYRYPITILVADVAIATDTLAIVTAVGRRRYSNPVAMLVVDVAIVTDTLAIAMKVGHRRYRNPVAMLVVDVAIATDTLAIATAVGIAATTTPSQCL